jgi:hypothetical protein
LPFASPGRFVLVGREVNNTTGTIQFATEFQNKGAHKLDLTDAGLLKDLRKRSETADGADLLVLKGGSKEASKRTSGDDGTD